MSSPSPAANIHRAQQADGVFTRMILLISLIPMIVGAIRCYLILSWPLTAGRRAEIRKQLEDRRGKIDMDSGGLALE